MTRKTVFCVERYVEDENGNYSQTDLAAICSTKEKAEKYRKKCARPWNTGKDTQPFVVEIELDEYLVEDDWKDDDWNDWEEDTAAEFDDYSRINIYENV
jgi:hypothetical protein